MLLYLLDPYIFEIIAFNNFRFWKNCCLAYVNQSIEQGLTLQAIPYLLAIHQTAEAIDKLCESHFYREAWCIAKMYKEPEDSVFEMIVNKWINYLEETGNLEGAALMLVNNIIIILSPKMQSIKIAYILPLFPDIIISLLFSYQLLNEFIFTFYSSYLAAKPQITIELLNKRNVKTSQIEEIIEMIQKTL